MTPQRRDEREHNQQASPSFFLFGLSSLIMGICVVLGIVLMLDSGGGGFFPDLGKALGILLIAAGNLVSWLLNLFCWYRVRRKWLGGIVAVQSLPALLLAGWLATLAADGFLESRASHQRANVYTVIKTDDIPALKQAMKKCRSRCQEWLSPARQLLIASQHGAYQAARYFIDQGARPYRQGSGTIEFYDAHLSLSTCEGRYLPALNAIDLAIANHDMAMLELLWPVGDALTRARAARTAAELDRLEMLKFMFDGQDGLLGAAASGAALDVGRWLLETRPVTLTTDDIQSALTQLLFFMMDINTPRSTSFGRLLLQHGADLQSARMNHKGALERAVEIRSKSLTMQLLELGADPSILSDEDASRLDVLLQQPDRPGSYRRNKEGCVSVNVPLQAAWTITTPDVP